MTYSNQSSAETINDFLFFHKRIAETDGHGWRTFSNLEHNYLSDDVKLTRACNVITRINQKMLSAMEELSLYLNEDSKNEYVIRAAKLLAEGMEIVE